jgi:FkbM family methyltransferase
LELVERFGCEVFLFDPSPVGAATVEALSGDERMRKIHFFPSALSGNSGEIQAAIGGDHGGMNWIRTGEGEAVLAVSIYDCMVRHKHNRIDLLKLDIEGFEYEVLEDCLTHHVSIRQICAEFHHFFKDISRFQTYAMLRKLKRAGFTVIHKNMCDITLFYHG